MSFPHPSRKPTESQGASSLGSRDSGVASSARQPVPKSAPNESEVNDEIISRLTEMEEAYDAIREEVRSLKSINDQLKRELSESHMRNQQLHGEKNDLSPGIPTSGIGNLSNRASGVSTEMEGENELENSGNPQPQSPIELPAEVKTKLRRLENMEPRYKDLLKSYRIAHKLVGQIEPFEKALQLNTPLKTISDPSALAEYLNQLNLKGDKVMDEFKRVSTERNDYKKKLEEAEKRATLAELEAVRTAEMKSKKTEEKAAWEKRLEQEKKAAMQAGVKAAKQAEFAAADEKAAWEKKIEEERKVAIEAGLEAARQAEVVAAEARQKAADEKAAWKKKIEEERKVAIEAAAEVARQAEVAAAEARQKAAEEQAVWQRKLKNEWRDAMAKGAEAIRKADEATVDVSTKTAAEREQDLLAQITSLSKQLSISEWDEQTLRREHDLLMKEVIEARNTISQLEAQINEASKSDTEMPEQEDKSEAKKSKEEIMHAREGAQRRYDNLLQLQREAQSDHDKRIRVYEQVFPGTIEVLESFKRGSFDKKVSSHQDDLNPGATNIIDAINSTVETVRVHMVDISTIMVEVGYGSLFDGAARGQNATNVWEQMAENFRDLARKSTPTNQDVLLAAKEVLHGDFPLSPITATQHGNDEAVYTTLTEISKILHNLTMCIESVSQDALNGRFPTGGFECTSGLRFETWKTLADDVNNVANAYIHLVRYVTDLAIAVAEGRTLYLSPSGNGFPPKGEVKTMQDSIDRMLMKLNTSQMRTTELGSGKQTEEQRKRLNEIWKVLHSTL